jgi:3',5'-cyclic AMP phosphodiesterase CpdA
MAAARRGNDDNGRMAVIAQLSDLHLLSGAEEQPAILSALVASLQQEAARRPGGVDLLAITGDVFNSASRRATPFVDAFLRLYAELTRALGKAVPTVIVPGNHDRRTLGLVGPFRKEPFAELKRALGDKAFVHGTSIPFLGQVVPPQFHGLPAWVVAFDSSYVPSGLISAGGTLRQEDILDVAAAIGGQNPDWPVLFLLHHHLVPTPLTDVGVVQVDRTPRLVRWGVEHLLPTLIANADREEMTMTALGAGTALSTLHALERAVLVLHGHKHYATARMLSGMSAGQGDVLIVSAGSCGTVQSWFPTTAKDAATLWPSFNIIELLPDRVRVDVAYFGYRAEAVGHINARPLVQARRDAAHWRVTPVPLDTAEGDFPAIGTNHLVCSLTPNLALPRWDCICERRYEAAPEGSPDAFGEAVDAIEDSELTLLDEHGNLLSAPRNPPTELTLQRGVSTRYRIVGAYCRTVSEAERLFGSRWAPYAWLGLMNRYASGQVRVELNSPGTTALRGAFASETDLGTGLQRPLRLSAESTDDKVIIVYEACPPRTLIRVYWRLEMD